MQPGKHASASVTPWDYEDAAPALHHAYLIPTILRQLSALPRGARVLDLGCGSGQLCAQLAASGFSAVGVDASESGIVTARRLFAEARFEVASATDVTLPSRLPTRFDAIVSMETIEHLYSPALFLQNCQQLIRRSGVLVITAPYHGYLKYLALAVAGKFDAHLQPGLEGGHIKFWSRRTMESAITTAGFRVTSFAGCGRLPFLWKSMVVAAVSNGGGADRAGQPSESEHIA